jgi:hypothetical protein
MQEQNFKNHKRIAPKSYYSGILLGLLVFLGALIKLFNNFRYHSGGVLTPVLIAFLGLGLIFIGYYARAFALIAQDRAIRAEENLRHFAFTGKLLSKELKLSQIIALRFASDEEFVELADRAVKEKLTNKQIKEAIKNWRGDSYRV